LECLGSRDGNRPTGVAQSPVGEPTGANHQGTTGTHRYLWEYSGSGRSAFSFYEAASGEGPAAEEDPLARSYQRLPSEFASGESTPLSALPRLGPRKVRVLERAGICSVEHLGNLSGENLSSAQERINQEASKLGSSSVRLANWVPKAREVCTSQPNQGMSATANPSSLGQGGSRQPHKREECLHFPPKGQHTVRWPSLESGVLSLEDAVDIVKSARLAGVPTLEQVPPKCRGLWGEVLRRTLDEVRCANHRERSKAYAVLHALPFLTLRAWGRNTAKRVNQRLACVKEGRLGSVVDSLVSDAHDMAAKRASCSPSGNLSAQQRNARAARRELARGNVSKANRLIIDDAEMASPDSDTVQELEQKHPQMQRMSVPGSLFHPVRQPPSLKVKEQTVKTALRNFKRGSAPGMSSLRFEHLSVIHRSRQALASITHFINWALEGHVGDDVAQVFGGARLLALRKPNGGGLRPIAVGETLRRLTGKCICIQLRRRFAHHFYPHQSGVAIKGGIEMVTHAVESLMDSPDLCECTMGIDLSNAFNEVEHKPIFEELNKHFPELLPFVASVYSNPTPLWLRMGSGYRTLWSVTGVQQGDPLGPFLFALAFHRVLSAVKSQCSLQLVAAYLDDITIAGSSWECKRALGVVVHEAQEIGLRVNRAKTVAYALKGGPLEPLSGSCHLAERGIEILGVPFGESDFVEEKLFGFLNKVEDHAQRIVDSFSEEDVQVGNILFRMCCATRFRHLLRQVRPSRVLSAARVHDEMLVSYFRKLNHIDDSALGPQSAERLQLFLPVREGGFGIPPMSGIYQEAWLGSWALSMQGVRKLLASEISPPLSEDEIEDGEESLASELCTCFHKAKQLGIPSLSQQSFTDFLGDFSEKLQAQLSRKRFSDMADSLISFLDDSGKARLRDVRREGGLWLQAFPSRRSLVLSNRAYAFAVQRRLGLTHFAEGMGHRLCGCERRVNLRANPAHYLRCKQGITWRHNQLKDPLCRLLGNLGTPPTREVPGMLADPNFVMDLVSYNWGGGGQALLLDISVVGTSASAYRQGAARDALHAARVRELEKHRHYPSDQVGSNLFVPFVVQEFGSLGSEATQWLSSLLHHHAHQKGVPEDSVADWVGSRRHRFLTELSTAFQAAQYGKFQLALGRSFPWGQVEHSLSDPGQTQFPFSGGGELGDEVAFSAEEGRVGPNLEEKMARVNEARKSGYSSSLPSHPFSSA